MPESEKVEATEEQAPELTEVVELDEETKEESEVQSVPIEDVSAEAEEESKDQDELEDYSKNVQKRIKTLTKKMREQERAAQSAFEYAQALQNENESLKQNSTKLNENYFSEAQSRLSSQRAQANAVLKTAYQDQDWDKVTKAQGILDKITVEESKLVNSKPNVSRETVYQEPQQPMRQPMQQPTQQPMQQVAPEPDPEAEDWASKNKWFGEDETMTLTAFNIHRKLIEEEGFDTNDSSYYTEIDKRIRVEFPHKFSDDGSKTESRIQQTVAPAGRSESSGRKRQVKLSKSEVEMARRLNVPLKEYAKHIKR
jgi:hypothetical protein|tara:strand:+ start:957 stop:1892 length:936 start_codon:yes stop_codon:yes gene_type:complete